MTLTANLTFLQDSATVQPHIDGGSPVNPPTRSPRPSGDGREVEIECARTSGFPGPASRATGPQCQLFIIGVLPCTSFVVQLNIYQIKIQIFILCNSSTGRSDEGVGGRGGAVII